MTLLLPNLDWLADTTETDESWPGPGPKLRHLQTWMDQLLKTDHRQLVLVTWCAATIAVQHWKNWVTESPEFATDSLCDSSPPDEQLAAVEQWMTAPTKDRSDNAIRMVDLTKQLHWFHDEFRETWFKYPGMWAAESSEFCVLSLTGDPYSKCDRASEGAISVSCAINSFRRSAGCDVREPLSQILSLVSQQQERAG